MNLILRATNTTMTSRQIAETVEASHENVLKRIRRLVDKGVVFANETQYKHPQNKQMYPEFTLDFRDTMVVVSGYNDKLRAAIIDRWQELEQKELDKENRKLTRNAARLENPIMNNALQMQRKSQGKDTSHFHYSNEADMINRIAVGLTASKYRKENGLDKDDPIRDHVTKCELECIEHLQRVNASLIDVGMGYDERKQRLSDLYQTHHKERLTAEFLRLEA